MGGGGAIGQNQYGYGGGAPMDLLSMLGISLPPMNLGSPPATTTDPNQSGVPGVPPGTGVEPPFLGVGVYRGRGPGGPGSDYYGWPDDARNSRTQFPPPPFVLGGQPYKVQ